MSVFIPIPKKGNAWNQDFWRSINNFRYADDTTFMAEIEKKLNKEPLDESERGGLKKLT